MSKKNIPPLTAGWLIKRAACHDGLMRFGLAAPSGSLIMDADGEKALSKHCEPSDLWWLLKRIIGNDGEWDIYNTISEKMKNVDGRSKRMAGYRIAYAAACVAAWREYHK